MPYLIDRHRAIRTETLIAVVRGRQRRVRSEMIFRDNSIYHTLTRPRTLLRLMQPAPEPSRDARVKVGRVTTLVWRTAQR